VSTTRLLVLGAVRIFQPVNGYLLRRELVSWQVADWAHIHPGSIYHTLRSLAAEGLLAEKVGEGEGAGRPAGTTYTLTEDGETKFFGLLREALWQVHPHAPDRLLAGLCFLPMLSREEALAAVEARVGQLEACIAATEFATPAVAAHPHTWHVPELFAVTNARLRGEVAWCVQFAERLRAGKYRPPET